MELLRSPFDTEECLGADESLRRECEVDDFEDEFEDDFEDDLEDDFERRDAGPMSFES